MDKVFLLDDEAYNVKVEKDSLERSLVIMDSEQSGRAMDYTMDRDIIGAFYDYTVKIYSKMDDLTSYDTLYNIMSGPDCASHEMTLLYGQETLTFQAYVSQGRDKLWIRNGKNIRGIDELLLNLTTMKP